MWRAVAWLCLVALGAGPGPARADPGAEVAPHVRQLADWALASGDSLGLPFMIIDKRDARVLAFDAKGTLQGGAPALLGLARGDSAPADIGTRRLADIAPAERITPAGRFVARLGRDLTEEVLWVDYKSALSLHRVVKGKPAERRAQRLASAAADDNRISYGCINVPVAFYDGIVRGLFAPANGIVYILPEVTPLHEAIPGFAPLASARTSP